MDITPGKYITRNGCIASIHGQAYNASGQLVWMGYANSGGITAWNEAGCTLTGDTTWDLVQIYRDETEGVRNANSR